MEAGSSAESAGIRAGDILIEFDGRPLRGSSDLRNSVGLVPVGETVELTLLRDGERKTVRARLGQAEAGLAQASEAAPQLRGAAFRDVDGGRAGVLVAEVESGSPAWRHGLREGDVVVSVNRKPVTSVRELEVALNEAGPVIALDIFRDDTQIFLVIQ